MSLENSIKALLEQRRTAEAPLEEGFPGAGSNKETEPAPQGSSQKASFEIVTNGKGGAKAGANELKPGAAAKEEKPAKQGSSQEPGWQDLGATKTGKEAADKMSETGNKPEGKGAGAAKNFTTVADPTKEVNKASSKGNVGAPGRKSFGESIEQLFTGDQSLSEEFKTKATNLFEALVTAAVTEEKERIEAEAAAAAADIIQAKEIELTEQVDKYLNYIAEQWIEKNEAVVNNSLKLELAESFMQGLHKLFTEHHVELPEGGTDIVAELQAEIDNLKAELNATIEAGVEVSEEVVALQRGRLLAEASVGLALTEAERLVTLCADVEFIDESTFKDKVAVIKESYFTKKDAPAAKAEGATEVVDAPAGEAPVETDPAIAKIVDAISRSSKF